MNKSDDWEEYKRNRYSKSSNKKDKDLAKKLDLIKKVFKKGTWKNLI